MIWFPYFLTLVTPNLPFMGLWPHQYIKKTRYKYIFPGLEAQIDIYIIQFFSGDADIG